MTFSSPLEFCRLACLLLICFSVSNADCPIASGQDTQESSPSLGLTKKIEQIVLPGTELTHKKVDPKTSPLIVRVVETFPHGDAFRYDITYFGMTAGEFDLRDFLERKDGSATDDLPPIPVTIHTILDEGHITPNELEIGSLSKYGGYWQLLIIGAIVWTIVLIALIFIGRKKKKIESVFVEKKVTLAELLKPSVEKAISGDLPREKHAELERMLFAFWQKKLGLSELDPAVAMSQIRNHDESGNLVRQIESWLHSPPGSQEAIDIKELLSPYQKYDATEFENVDKEDYARPAS